MRVVSFVLGLWHSNSSVCRVYFFYICFWWVSEVRARHQSQQIECKYSYDCFVATTAASRVVKKNFRELRQNVSHVAAADLCRFSVNILPLKLLHLKQGFFQSKNKK